MTQKSTPTASAPDLDGATWHKSTYSGADNACVEHARLRDGRQAVRDTKDREGPALIFDTAAWGVFVQAVADGEFGTV
jgi:Domain of unknown function (DUF397)